MSACLAWGMRVGTGPTGRRGAATTAMAATVALASLLMSVDLGAPAATAGSRPGTRGAAHSAAAMAAFAGKAAGSWSAPVTLGRGSSMSLTAGRTATTLVWAAADFSKDGPIHARSRPVGKGWERPQELGPPGGTYAAVGSNRLGLTVAAWYARAQRRMLVARRPSGGPWQPAVVMDRRVPVGRLAVGPYVAVSDSGAVLVWWDEEIEGDCDNWWSYLAYSTASGAWESPHEVGDGSCNGGLADAAIGARGNVNVAYRTRDGLRFTRRVLNRGWTPARVLTRSTARFGPVLMRTPRGGTLVVAWQRGDETAFEARRRIDGRWGPIHVWAKQDGFESSWDAAMDDRGNATLGWSVEAGVIKVRRWPRRGPVGGQQTLVDEPADSLDAPVSPVQVAVGGGGAAVVPYFVDFGKHAGLHLLYRRTSGDWVVEPVLKTNQPADYRLAISPSGTVHVAWAAHRRLRYSTLTP